MILTIGRRAWFPSILALIFCGCSRTEQQQTSVPRAAIVPVSVATAVARDVPVQVHAVGNVEAYSTVSVKSLVGGELEQVHFKEGREVREGELLFSIDPRPFKNDLERARANLERDKALLSQAEANQARDEINEKRALADLKRYDQLVQKGVSSAEVLDRLQTAAEAAAASVRASRAAVDNARQTIRADQAAVENAALQLEYCSIRSPIAGRTGSLVVHPGNLVKASDSTALVVIHRVSPIYVNFSVPEQHLPEIRRRMAVARVPVRAVLSPAEGAPVEGVLTFIENAVDTTTGTIRLKADFPNTDRRLWPGQFVSVVLGLGEQKNVVVVPSQALQTGQSGPFVFVVKPDQTAEPRAVTAGMSAGGETVIEKGVAAGETVVTDGQNALVPGSRVSVKPAIAPRQEQRS